MLVLFLFGAGTTVSTLFALDAKDRAAEAERERDKARDAYERLRRLEPTFSLDAMRETTYPSTGIRASGLLSFSDKDL